MLNRTVTVCYSCFCRLSDSIGRSQPQVVSHRRINLERDALAFCKINFVFSAVIFICSYVSLAASCSSICCLINKYSTCRFTLSRCQTAAVKKNKWQDSVISTLVIVFVSVPSYVYAFLVQYIFYFKLGWLPLQVYSLADAGGSWLTGKMLYSMIAPVLALSFSTIAGMCRFTRAELTETLTSDYMLLARAKGLTRSQATARPALKNAMVPILPMIISSFVGILGGSFIIEQIFAIPGVGQLYLQSISLFDYDVFMLDSVFYTFIGLLAGILVDLSYGFIDPRIRMGEK